ncbi:hypothetical protein KC19_2G140700 [Ceratodon purpureus]|uniref:Uncharacterized protein n=1 Tax=Ceratodon purpureus TaxID=3225 RepID=A0A8T0IWR0_CERPU|nr:hypothetical protein KC19_2G140700 [Ceratodon purpureus]
MTLTAPEDEIIRQSDSHSLPPSLNSQLPQLSTPSLRQSNPVHRKRTALLHHQAHSLTPSYHCHHPSSPTHSQTTRFSTSRLQFPLTSSSFRHPSSRHLTDARPTHTHIPTHSPKKRPNLLSWDCGRPSSELLTYLASL